MKGDKLMAAVMKQKMPMKKMPAGKKSMKQMMTRHGE